MVRLGASSLKPAHNVSVMRGFHFSIHVVLNAGSNLETMEIISECGLRKTFAKDVHVATTELMYLVRGTFI